jgi:hypothetical protein
MTAKNNPKSNNNEGHGCFLRYYSGLVTWDEIIKVKTRKNKKDPQVSSLLKQSQLIESTSINTLKAIYNSSSSYFLNKEESSNLRPVHGKLMSVLASVDLLRVSYKRLRTNTVAPAEQLLEQQES